MSAEQAKARFMAALALQVPCTADMVYNTAAQVLTGNDLTGFNAWFEKHSTQFLAQVNGE